MLRTWLVFPTLLPMAIAIFAFGYQFKLVRVKGSCLVVSNGDREVHVPLRHVAHVSLSWTMNPTTVLLQLRERSAFGHRIIFVPKSRSAAARLEHLIQGATDTSCAHGVQGAFSSQA